MPWCPNCKNEYRQGIQVCADCGSVLVENLFDGKQMPVMFGSEDLLERMVEFYEYCNIGTSEIKFNEEAQMFELYVAEADYGSAKKFAAVFLKEEAERKKAESFEEENANNPIEGDADSDDVYEAEDVYDSEDEENAESEQESEMFRSKHSDEQVSNVYVKAEEKAENYKASAYALLLTGSIGIILMILIMTGIIPLRLAANAKYISYGTMSLLFLIFIVIGFSSFKSSKKFLKEAEKENKLEKEIFDYFISQYTKEQINNELGLSEQDGLSEELKYFKRAEWIKQQVLLQAPEIQNAYLEKITDELYQELYEK